MIRTRSSRQSALQFTISVRSNRSLLKALQLAAKYRWYAIAIVWMVAVAGWATVFTLPNDYQTSARVLHGNFFCGGTDLSPAVSSFAACPTPAGDAFAHQFGPVAAAGIGQPLTKADGRWRLLYTTGIARPTLFEADPLYSLSSNVAT